MDGGGEALEEPEEEEAEEEGEEEEVSLSLPGKFVLDGGGGFSLAAFFCRNVDDDITCEVSVMGIRLGKLFHRTAQFMVWKC